MPSLKKLNKQTSYLADNQIQITEFILVTFLADQEAEPMTDRIPLEPSILPLNRNLMNFQHCACSIVWNAQVRPLDFTAQWPPGMLRTMNKNVLKRERKKNSRRCAVQVAVTLETPQPTSDGAGTKKKRRSR